MMSSLAIITVIIIAATLISTVTPLSSHTYKPHFKAKIAHSIAKGERRQSDRDATPRKVCDCCSRPSTICVCSALPDELIPTVTQILILQHPNERRRKHFSTVPLLRLVLKNVQVRVGYAFTAEDLAPLIKGRTSFLLYPNNDAISLDDGFDPDLSTRVNHDNDTARPSNNNNSDGDDTLLILIDGTWTEAKRIARSSPELFTACQQVQFSGEAESCIYDTIRKEPASHCLSTLEACVKALAILEPCSNTTYLKNILESVLQIHVNSHLVNAQLCVPRSKQKLYEKNKRRREIEHELFGEKEERIEMLANGATIRPLNSQDAALVDSWWEYRSDKSLPLVSRRIELDGGVACLGVDLNGSLVACVSRYEGGALGMLHVQESYRRRGYGLALLKQASEALGELKQERVAFIVDGNTASEALFTKAGWIRADTAQKKCTGKRRAKRKWIKP